MDTSDEHEPIGRNARRPVKRLIGLLLPLSICMGGYGVTTAAQLSPQENTVKITLRVLDPATEEAKKLPKTRESHEGRPIVHLTLQDKAASVSVLPNSYIVLHASRKVLFTIDKPDVLEVPAQLYVFPSDVQGILQAKKPGTAVISIDSGPAEVCGIVAGCSPNWAGYVLGKGGPFTGVTAQWTVPTIDQSSPHGSSSTWVGIDGLTNNTVLQAGTEQDYHPWYDPFGGPDYYAWFEVFPSPQSPITPVAGIGNFLGSATSNNLSPGDIVLVSITPAIGTPIPVPGNAGHWVIQFTDQTQNWSFSTTVTYAGDLSSAEWIEEATSGPSGIQTLADYNIVSFDLKDQVATGGGPLGSPNFNSGEEVSMSQQLGPDWVYSTPSNPDGDLDGFSVTYNQNSPNRAGPPGPFITSKLLPPALLNQTYNQTLTVVQAASPSWTLNGSLPPGLVFKGTMGTVSGIPSLVGTFPFSVVATDTSTGAFSQTQSLSIQVLSTPSATLQLLCSPGNEMLPATPSAAIDAKIDGKSAQCGPPVTLALGVHKVSATVSGFGQPYQVFYGGTCNAAGLVSLSQGNIATCIISVEARNIVQNACPNGGEHCCSPSAKGCKLCYPANKACP
jgi:hypothetical protein